MNADNIDSAATLALLLALVCGAVLLWRGADARTERALDIVEQGEEP
jgi:hypothetical protein